MKRKTCAQVKNEDPNWGDKTDVELSERVIVDQANVVYFSEPRMVKFNDVQMNGLDKILAYSCSVVN